jgi:hypothetical protein
MSICFFKKIQIFTVVIRSLKSMNKAEKISPSHKFQWEGNFFEDEIIH